MVGCKGLHKSYVEIASQCAWILEIDGIIFVDSIMDASSSSER